MLRIPVGTDSDVASAAPGGYGPAMPRDRDIDDSALPPADAAVELGPLAGMLFHNLRRAEAGVLLDLHAALDREDLRSLQFAALVVLRHNPGLRQSQVSFALGIHRANFVPLLDGLEQRGLAERRGVPGDRRAKGLFLTPLGAETLARAEAAVAAHEARLAARLGAAERLALVGLLQRLSSGWPTDGG